MNYDDLPANLRAQVDAKLGKPPGRGGKRRSKTDSAPCPGRCLPCDEHFDTYLAWAHHADATSGRHMWRIDT